MYKRKPVIPFEVSQIMFGANELEIIWSRLDAFSPLAIVYCYLEFKLRYLKNLKLFLVRVKELSEPIAL